MNHKLTRRRFGQLAIAGTAATGLAYFANKTFAQTPSLVVIGADGRITSTDNAATTEVNSSEVDTPVADSTGAASTTHSVVVQSLNVTTGEIQTVLQTPAILQSHEQFTGLTYLSNGTLVLAITPVSTSKKGGNPTRLTILGTSPTTVTVTGLKKQEKLESLVGTNQGGLLGLVVKKNGTPPVKLVDIDVQTGKINFTEKVKLPGNERFANLVQCPDGKLYTSTVSKQGETSLVQLELGKKKAISKVQLRFNDSTWNNGLQSLVCSLGGQLLALGALRYESPNYLHIVNPSTGAMTRLIPFDVAKTTIARA